VSIFFDLWISPNDSELRLFVIHKPAEPTRLGAPVVWLLLDEGGSGTPAAGGLFEAFPAKATPKSLTSDL